MSGLCKKGLGGHSIACAEKHANNRALFRSIVGLKEVGAMAMLAKLEPANSTTNEAYAQSLVHQDCHKK